MRPLTAVPMSLLCLVFLLAPSGAAAAQDIFLVISGLDGESTDDEFRGAFEASAVTSGVTSENGGAPTFAPVVVTLRRTSAGSPTLEQAASTGQRFPQAVVSLRRTGENRFVFLTYTLTDVTVRSFQRSASAAEDEASESVSLSYAQIRTDYRRQNADGSAGPVVSVCWDVRTNARCP